ncbi:hypothetical protein [Comamonas testosteroni]|uniref:DUF7673 family protein n=1 Tax=Comamonas testosteroni TaxID=285 RepID=UPI0026EAF4EC|nr:hypothetical protein [Comamonas testosteroni]
MTEAKTALPHEVQSMVDKYVPARAANSVAEHMANQLQVDELEILSRFFFLAWGHSHSGAKVAAGLLLGLYNGTRFPFDLTDLRLLDGRNMDDALALMRFDSRPAMEVHQWLNKLYGRHDFGDRFEHLAHFWRMKGKCKREYLTPLAQLPEIAELDFQQQGGAE